MIQICIDKFSNTALTQIFTSGYNYATIIRPAVSSRCQKKKIESVKLLVLFIALLRQGERLQRSWPSVMFLNLRVRPKRWKTLMTTTGKRRRTTQSTQCPQWDSNRGPIPLHQPDNPNLWAQFHRVA